MKRIFFYLFLFQSLSFFAQKTYQLLANSDKVNLSVISKKAADDLFKEFDNSSLFNMKDCNNCEDRANAIAVIMKKRGYNVAKFWLFGEGKITLSSEIYLLKSESCGTWGYHVAVGLVQEENGKNDTIILDPAIKKRAVTLKDWVLPLIQDNRTGFLIVKDPSFYTYPVNRNVFVDCHPWTDKDVNLWRTACGLCGLKPNQCDKEKFKKQIEAKKKELESN